MTSGPAFIVRPATDADSAAVRELVAEVSREFGLAADFSGDDADLVEVGTSYGQRRGWFELLCRDGHPVGTIGMMPMDAGTIELRKMYFRPDARGLGFGKALLMRNLERARQRGYRQVVLETATVLETAIALYARFGFERDDGGSVACGKGCDQVWRLQLADYRAPDGVAANVPMEEGG